MELPIVKAVFLELDSFTLHMMRNPADADHRVAWIGRQMQYRRCLLVRGKWYSHPIQRADKTRYYRLQYTYSVLLTYGTRYMSQELDRVGMEKAWLIIKMGRMVLCGGLVRDKPDFLVPIICAKKWFLGHIHPDHYGKLANPIKI